MKSKKVMLLFAISMVFSFAACGTAQTETGENSVKQEMEQKETQEEEAAGGETTETTEGENLEETDSKETSVSAVTSDIEYLETDQNASLEDVFAAELHNFKIVQSLEPAFEESSYQAYVTLAGQLNNAWTGEQNQEAAPEVRELRQKLVQIKSCADVVWEIWGDAMAINDADNFTEEDFTTALDNSDFKPFLIPYLVENQEETKGNVIVIAGGGYYMRMNTYEGFPVAEKFNELGYNAYVLQRRVTPYSQEDIWMDMQRAVRYLRYYGAEKGLGGLECIAAAGFSGGGSTILGQIAKCYGDLTPDQLYDSDYVPDEVDRVSGDLDVAMIIYGPLYDYENQGISEYTGAMSGVFETENPNLPAMYIVAGQNDSNGTAQTSLDLYLSVCDKTSTEMHIYRDALHGFGVGYGLDGNTFEDVITYNVQTWPELADTFMGIQTGRIEELVYPNR